MNLYICCLLHNVIRVSLNVVCCPQVAKNAKGVKTPGSAAKV